MKKYSNIILLFISLVIFSLGFVAIYYLKENTSNNGSIYSMIEKKQASFAPQTFEETTIETIVDNTNTDFDALLTNLSDSEQIATEVSQLIQNQYQNQYLSAQDDIVKAINANQLNIEETGYLFLPTYPAQHVSADVNQIDIPLLLQKDQAWRKESYGFDTTKELGENGCAILTLAMIDSYYKDRIVEPTEILSWSGNNFYLENQGTSWNIFHNFAQAYGYQFENFGNNFERAMSAVEQGRIVIVSVNPGHFTTVGHIFLIRGYDRDNHLVYINDPNDNSEKMFSLQGIPESYILADALNYWTIYK